MVDEEVNTVNAPGLRVKTQHGGGFSMENRPDPDQNWMCSSASNDFPQPFKPILNRQNY
jgi:hypothetical protein